MLAKELGNAPLHVGSQGAKLDEMPSTLDGKQERPGNPASDRLCLGKGHALVCRAMHDQRRRSDTLEGKIGQRTELKNVIANACLSHAQRHESSDKASEPFELIRIVYDRSCQRLPLARGPVIFSVKHRQQHSAWIPFGLLDPKPGAKVPTKLVEYEASRFASLRFRIGMELRGHAGNKNQSPHFPRMPNGELDGRGSPR